ncbi:16S rRNA pseudouridine(516) synthase RsuA [Escherichia coli]
MRLDKFIAQQLGVSRAIAGREIRAIVSPSTAKSSVMQRSNCSLNMMSLTMATRWRSNTVHVTSCSISLRAMFAPRTTLITQRCSIFYQPVAWKLHAAGRLDIDTTGLVLMTDDGQWSHRITSPRHHCEKTYLVTLESPVADDTAEQFAKGVQLHNEKDRTKPAVLEVITPTQVRLTISEGRYHQVKRMFAAVGNHVVELHRERIGGITLDADLAPGEYRPLTEEEIASVV